MTEEQREVVGLTNERGETRQYETVASRLARFRAAHPAHALRSEVLRDDGDSFVVKAQIGFYTESDFFCVLAEGHSEEFRSASTINRTSALEVAETSAWGRALAAFGFGSPVSIASADEVEKAQRRERELKDQDAKEPGTLILLQNAALGGTVALQEAWMNELTKRDRHDCSKYMNNLKKQAAKVDKKRSEPHDPV